MKILICQINPSIGDFKGNLEKILHNIDLGKKQSADLILFPELTICGYPPRDFLLHEEFIHEVNKSLEAIIDHSENVAVIVGLPRKTEAKNAKLYNSAAIIENKKLIGFQDKTLIPSYDVFDEKRYFQPGKQEPIFTIKGKRIAVTICEDIWPHAKQIEYTGYSHDPIEVLKDHSPYLMVNLSASPFYINKIKDRYSIIEGASKTLNCPVILCNQVGANDSLIFDGFSLIANKGQTLDVMKGFEEDSRLVDIDNLQARNIPSNDPVQDLYYALILGIRDYFQKSGLKKACLGLSGGIDSAIAAVLIKEALGPENILGIAMPSRYSSEHSLTDAEELARNLGIDMWKIPIEGPFQSYLELLNPFFLGKGPDLTEENLQARIRGMILMAIANKHGYIVISTGNKSELAMGYSTLYGDLSGGLAPLADVSKDMLYKLASFINKKERIIPQSTIDKPPSAELREGQLDSDSLPPYPLIDLIVEEYIEKNLSPEKIAKKHNLDLKVINSLINRIHRSEFKRRQAPPGLKVTEKSFSIGRRYPIVHSVY